MPTTPQSGLRYPALTDDPNVPEDIQNLALDVDTKIIPRFTNASARNTAITSPVEGQLAYLNDTNSLTWYTGSAWQGTWTSYTPTWSTSGGTQPVLGNGTLTGRYLYMPGKVIAEVRLVLGSTTTGGTGVWFFSLPVTASSATVGGGTAFVNDALAQDYACITKMETTTTFRVVWHTGSVDSSVPVPFAWGANDELRAQMIYSPA